MKKLLLFCVLVFYFGTVAAETVSNVRVRQNGEEIEIIYDLEKSSIVTVFMSKDGKGFEPLTDVTGDVGKNVSPGKNKKIIWQPLKNENIFIAEGVRFYVEGLTNYQNYAANAKIKTMVLAEASGIITDILASNTGQSFGEKLNYGLMLGQVYSKYHIGWYVNFRSNFKTYEYQYKGFRQTFYNGNKKTMSLMFGGGLIGQIIEKSKSPTNHFNTLGVYLGAGWYSRNVFWETANSDLVWVDYSHNNDYCLSIGLIGSLYGFTLKAGVNTIHFQLTELELGLGWMF